MTRLGWFLLALFAVVIAGFVLIVRISGGPALQSGGIPDDASRSAAGRPAIPVAGVKPGQLVDTWGDSRANGGRAHEAIDIMAARGTPVSAASAGTVEKIFESTDGGHTVYVRRDDPTWQDYYAHLDTYAADLREGIRVRQGQQIGTVGSTGDASADAPHLHYEIHRMAPGDGWWKGTAINPYPILAGKPAAR